MQAVRKALVSLAATAAFLATLALASGWIGIAMAGGGRWTG